MCFWGVQEMEVTQQDFPCIDIAVAPVTVIVKVSQCGEELLHAVVSFKAVPSDNLQYL